MRGILSIIFTVILLQVNAQGINFQGVARSANGTILASSNISLRLSIISKNVDATPEYVETKTVVTNAQGIFSIVVGDASGTSVTGNFKNIVWSDGPKFLKVEMDPSGGTNFINMGATQLQYVPYSFYSFSVDASGVKGILPVEKGGTGVGSLVALKTALNIPASIDTTSLSNRINQKASLDNPKFTGTVTGSFKGDLLGNITGNVTGSASNITGVLTVANGGTGLSDLTANNVLLGNGTNALLTVAPGTNGNILTSDGTTWKSLPPNQSNNSSSSQETISRRILNQIYLKF